MDELISGYLWVEQMKNAMDIMSKACHQSKDCTKCPFDPYCEACMQTGKRIPRQWSVEVNKND